ncbi:MAG: glutathione S-transferase family protein [Rhodospirillaceae bacterium]|nr:glutathione S-transferase family protein [Rhodospirillaceae bacterium]MBT5667611.1 glutathione S-transferase family protein [Rhodospirillaceae bacterium]MBT5809823.1 glutathione S-transferase family protein [Rhodospirillaceae bacterium]
MALEIIGFPRSNFVRTVCMVAREKGVDYDLTPAMPHSDEVRAIHPMGQIPVMRHDGLELAESQAIARYIDDSFDGAPMIPRDPRAAAPVNQWISMTASSVDQLLMRRYVVEYAFHKDDDGNVVRTEIDKAIKRFPRMFAMLEAAVAPGFLGSDSFSMADCFLVPILSAARSFPEGEAALAGSPALTAYFEKIAARPSFVDTAP